MKYALIHNHDKYILKIWEPAPVEGARLLPVLYLLQLSFTSKVEARQYFDYHLEMNREAIPDLENWANLDSYELLQDLQIQHHTDE
jgi:hypothetical protein